MLFRSRADTVAACLADGIEFWDDPHNADPGFARVRVRQRVLPVLEDELGPGIAATLARTADQVRADVEALDALAATAYDDLAGPDGLDLAGVQDLLPALGGRVLRLAALTAGAVDAELFHVHVAALQRLASGESGGEVQLPGHVTAYRDRSHLLFRRTAVAG